MRAFSIAVFSALGLWAAGPAQALTPVSTEEYIFTGVCEDCGGGDGVGALVLKDYALGGPLSTGDFVSFSYSSKVISYTITTISDLSGSLPMTLPSAAQVTIEGLTEVGGDTVRVLFTSYTNGQWCTGANCGADYGVSGSWSVPEPSTWALMIVGFGGLGFMGYRRARTASPTA